MIRFLVSLIVAFSLLTASASAQRQAAIGEDADAIERARVEYAQVRAALEDGELDDATRLETRVRRLRDASRERLLNLDREIASVRTQLDALGPAPGEGEPPESEDLAAQRNALAGDLSRLTGQRTLVNANVIEANDLLGRISATRVQSFYGRLIERSPSPLSPSVWRPALAGAVDTAEAIGDFFDEGAREAAGEGALLRDVIALVLAVSIALILFWPVNRWMMRTFSAAIAHREATPARRIVAAGLRMIARAVSGIVGGLIVIETLRALDILTPEGEGPARAFWFAYVVYLLVSGFLSGLFAPANPDWRIAKVDERRGAQISFLVNAIVLIFGAKSVLVAIFEAANAAPELTTVVNAAVAIVISVLLFLLCRTRLWRAGKALGLSADDADEGAEKSAAAPTASQTGETARRPVDGWRLTRRLGRAFAVATILAAVAGYVALADFAASRLYYLSIIFASAWFLRALLQEVIQLVWRRQRRDYLKTASAEDAERRAANFRFWSGLVVNAILALVLVPAVLVLAGVPSASIRDIAQQAFFGFTLFGVRIPSLAKIFLAALVFFALFFLTRGVQQGVRAGPFAHSQIDPGVQNSLITLIGYAGLIIALLAAVTAVGFDLSNLALIAGALSVGIGFGLQSIVNNFVSGLILLFERPIKVGDLIVTASGEGIVQKISVRSTEIQTWDRSSIIVPNSELISSTVTNWTHKNALGRVIVPVGVSYDSDPQLVKDILLKCVKAHPKILRYPEPFVVWNDYGASSLDFDVRGYVSDITSGLGVRTDLRFAIFKALKEAGVEIPFPQRDVHVKSWPEPMAQTRAPEREDIERMEAPPHPKAAE